MASTRIKERAVGYARRAKKWAAAHKFWSGVIIVAALFGAYRVYAAATAPSAAPSYLTATTATGTVVASLTETGQVSASQQLTLSPKASGEVVGVYATAGEHVYAGQVLAQLDASDAQASLQSAELSLKNQELQYQQSTATSTLALNLLEAQSGATSAQIALQKAHDASYTSIASIYTDFSTVTQGLQAALNNDDVVSRPSQDNLDAYADIVSNNDQQISVFKNSAATSYAAALTAYNTAVAAYKAVGLSATDAQIETLADQTYAAAQIIAQAVKDAHDFYDRVDTDYTLYNYGSKSGPDALLATVSGYQTTISADLSDSLSAKSNLISAEESLAQAQDALAKAEGGANTLTVQQAALALEQAQQAVTTAQETVADYTVVAPFSGTIAAVGVKKFDQASPTTSVATILTDEQTVNISVNEVDAAKLKVGQKATLTFDALPGVSIAGTVSEVDTLGTVSSGVVSYNAVITFDTPNASVEPGMSASASIITGTQTGLVVPSSAVHTQGGASYVEVFNPPLSSGVSQTTQLPTPIPVVVGISSVTQSVITAGLTPGTQVVTGVSGGTVGKSAAANATSAFGGGGRPGGGAVFRAGGG